MSNRGLKILGISDMKLKSKTSKKTASNDALDKNIIIFSAVFIFWV